jgi:hypothetical protein
MAGSKNATTSVAETAAKVIVNDLIHFHGAHDAR